MFLFQFKIMTNQHPKDCKLFHAACLVKYNLNKQRQFQTDGRRCHDQQQGGSQKLLCQNDDGTWLSHCRISFSSRFEPDRDTKIAGGSIEKRRSTCWLAATHKYRVGTVLYCAREVLKLIMIIVSLQMKLF